MNEKYEKYEKYDKGEEQVRLAKEIANNAHKGQIRTMGDDKGKPYIVHPERVANRLKDNFILESAGYLHDVVEDSALTFDDLFKLGIMPEVIHILRFVTKKDNENYKSFILRIMHDIDAVRVKIADLEDNLISCPEGHIKDKYRLALWILKTEIYLMEAAND